MRIRCDGICHRTGSSGFVTPQFQLTQEYNGTLNPERAIARTAFGSYAAVAWLARGLVEVDERDGAQISAEGEEPKPPA